MYSGISNTILGLGLVLDQPGIILAGILWFLLVRQPMRNKRKVTVGEGTFATRIACQGLCRDWLDGRDLLEPS